MKHFLLATAAAISLQVSSAAIAPGFAQDGERDFFDGLEYRNIGPFRGGRVTAVAGHTDDPQTYYMGSTGGGVWKTHNGGASWENVSDEYFATGSVGAIDVADSDPNVVVVGMGESPYRGVSSHQGDGVYKSTDAGKSWTHMGLEDTRTISTVLIHPDDPDVIWVAAQGNSWAPSDDRGVYKSTDGGETWRKVLAGENETTGAVDLSYDPGNPRILYAAMWDHQRTPWQVRSGGPGSGIWKSTDGGESWTEVTNDLPDLVGKIGVAVSPANPDRIYAIVEATDKGGLYRSDNGGESWSLMNASRRIQSRPWYYMHIYADPQDENTVYVHNSGFYKFIDGGKTFSTISGPHGDYHDLWINPDNPKNMINANDGGATVSYDGGETWSTIYNQPTAQFYRVNADNQLFYKVYAGQQDNSTVAIYGIAPDGVIAGDDYHSVGGCESAHVGFDPDNPRYVYAGCYLGQINEYDQELRIERDIEVYNELDFGGEQRNKKYRFNWNAPIIVSRFDPDVIYHAGNQLFRSTDRGYNWEVVSPDLSRDNEEHQIMGGVPITNEISENYATILALAESHFDANVLWAGTDDGRLHVTRDGGASWTDISPRGLGLGMVNSIEPSPHDPATAYAVVAKYKLGDDRPYIYKTTNYGRSWSRIDDGLPDDAFARVVREDTERAGLLFAGTERAVFVSFNDGDDWRPLQSNLPAVPVTDMILRDNNLILSTSGRAFWALDDISPLRQHAARLESAAAHLYRPSPAWLLEYGGGARGAGPRAENPPNAAMIFYSLAEAPDLEETTLKLEILDADGGVVRTLKSDAETGAEGGGSESAYKLPARAGLNRAVWDYARENAAKVDGIFSMAGGGDNVVAGPIVAPGRYTARLTLGDQVVGEEGFEFHWDPRLETTPQQIADQQALANEIFDMIDTLGRSIAAMRSVREQAGERKSHAEESGQTALVEAADALIGAIDDWEASVVSAKREYFQDVLNYPDRIYTKLQQLYGNVNGARTGLTMGMRDRAADLRVEYGQAVAARDAVIEGAVRAYNAAFRSAGAEGVHVPPFDRSADD